MAEYIRLQKWLAMAGIASRRKAEQMILDGRVRLDGAVVTELGAKADPAKSTLSVDGKPVEIVQDKVYIMLHKPEGVVTTVTDPYNRPTVMDLVPDATRLYPVGRLDSDTSGLLLMTNDGEWAQKLTHPKHETQKTYVAVVHGVPSVTNLRIFRQGILIDGKKTARAQIKLLEQLPIKGKKEQNSKLLITIHEGRNHQVRKMCEAIGHKIITLKRVEVGGLLLGNLAKGKWRHLTPKEAKRCISNKRE